jgi:hypothetical protein
MPPFEGSHLKIKRANQHIDDLETIFSQFLRTDFYALGAKAKPQIGYVAYYVTRVDPLPEDVPLILGDAVHNLRTALDHFMWELVGTLCPSAASRHTEFPITKTSQQYNSAFGKREITEMREDIAEFLREIQPYRTTDDTLWDLHQLDIDDKHKLIIPVACAINSWGLKKPRIWLGDLSNSFHIELGEELLNIPADTYAKNHDDIEFGVNVTFRDPDIARGRTVLETLQHLASFVDMIVTTVERRL